MGIPGHQVATQLNDYDQPKLKALLSEEEYKAFIKHFYIHGDDIESFNKSLAKLAIKVDQKGVPDDADEKINTPGFNMKLFEAAGMNDKAKIISEREYNNRVEKLNRYLPDLLSIDKIDRPTTKDIYLDLLSKETTIKQVYTDKTIDVSK